jgi:hypothetical protein
MGSKIIHSLSYYRIQDASSIPFIVQSGMREYTIEPPLNDFSTLKLWTVQYDSYTISGFGIPIKGASHVFTVYVVNTAPTYISAVDCATYPGVSKSCILPGTQDAEGHSVT